MKKGISLVINTKNEEKNIVDCIRSAMPLANEIIVVDMQSHDKTVSLAKQLGAKVFKVPDYGYVEPARQYAISKASCEWILVIDADERMPKTLINKISLIIKENRYDLVSIPHKNILLRKWIKHSMWWPDYHIRLFRSGHVIWAKDIHQQGVFSGNMLTLPPLEKYAFIHQTKDTISDWIRLIDNYTNHETTFSNKDISTPSQLIDYYEHEFKWRYLEHRGYLDGYHGFILSKLMEFYRFIEFAKYWEKNHYNEAFNPLLLRNELERRYQTINNNESTRSILNQLAGQLIRRFLTFYNKILRILFLKA